MSTLCAQLHAGGSPGSDGKSNPAAETNRLQIGMTTANAAAQLSGTGPSWTIIATQGEDLTAISLWDGFEDDPNAICWFTLPVTPNVVVAYGDVVTLTTCNLAGAGLAS
ncbi:hypothetical protein KXD96_28075 (plasmid) [Mycobacterium sp. SMC-2]|uniref:hypothetical protein n=1 Tax=Mycobacterium sp. SMC-2 TaxID=2857058 RepID=UPI0021B3CE79|nr:hypothetical protein [Mycobacterium sp. SMC-2]UXA06595.1 hypothetical protein KXD96_27930 [Mycobacterium sp. SMC-2]UXA09689.1 hypothetical protein KXD96_28075 [Mycobacterium sp. SMC-2]